MGFLDGIDIEKPDSTDELGDVADLIDELSKNTPEGEDYSEDDMGFLDGIDSNVIDAVKKEIKNNIKKKDL
jgi:hypothetical protein